MGADEGWRSEQQATGSRTAVPHRSARMIRPAGAALPLLVFPGRSWKGDESEAEHRSELRGWGQVEERYGVTAPFYQKSTVARTKHNVKHHGGGGMEEGGWRMEGWRTGQKADHVGIGRRIKRDETNSAFDWPPDSGWIERGRSMSPCPHLLRMTISRACPTVAPKRHDQLTFFTTCACAAKLKPFHTRRSPLKAPPLPGASHALRCWRGGGAEAADELQMKKKVAMD